MVIDAAHLLTFLTAALVLAIIPGPGMLYVTARTLGGGRREGLRSTAGTAIGGSLHMIAAAAGLSAVLATSAVAFSVVKYAGAAYLIYLGLRTLLRCGNAFGPGDTERPSSGAALRQGAVTEALNPKTALFFLAFVPQFLDPAAGSVLWQSVLLGSVVVVLNSLADIVAVLLVTVARGRLVRGGRAPHWPRLASGGALLALGGYAAVEA